MHKNILSLLLLVTILASTGSARPLLAATDTSPEEQCFQLLVDGAKDYAPLASLDLAAVSKVNVNSRGREVESDPFSVATYGDFMKAFDQEIPVLANDIKFYPNKMNKVSGDYKFTRKVHKSNRNNAGVVVYKDGSATKIDYWVKNKDDELIQQIIDGYYVDSRYVTFGRKSDLAFSFPSRDQNPGDANGYPTGRPVKDMREYVLYTHNLAPQYGGDFMSCGLIRMTPQPGYSLTGEEPGTKSISWENYGGTYLPQSDASTNITSNSNFRKGEIGYTTTDRQSLVTADSSPGKLLRFSVLVMAYNNRNDFMNPFKTLGLFDKAMKSTDPLSKSFLDMRKAFYKEVQDSGLNIGQ